MKELLKTKRITIAALSFVIVLLIGVATMKKPVYEFKMNPQDLSEQLFSIYQVTPDEAMEWMYDSSLAVFVDIRGIYDFERGHLENAINIPIPNLLETENKLLYDNWLNDSLTVVLYGNDELQANAAWMLMYQLGYTNMRMLQGGNSYIDKLYNDELGENESFNVEDPAFDYAQIVKDVKLNTNQPEQKEAPKKKVVIRQKKKKAAEGGC